MSETDEYILDAIRTWVWSGFYTPEDVDEMIDDILEEDADEEMLRAAVKPEFERKAAKVATWPKETDCDRLDRAFASLNDDGVVALQNTGMTMSDGLDDVYEARQDRGGDTIQGYCFFHGQDLERAVAGEGLFLAFGSFDDDPEAKRAVGQKVKRALEEVGLGVTWDGDPEVRLSLPSIVWQRRGPT